MAEWETENKMEKNEWVNSQLFLASWVYWAEAEAVI